MLNVRVHVVFHQTSNCIYVYNAVIFIIYKHESNTFGCVSRKRGACVLCMRCSNIQTCRTFPNVQ